MNRSSLRGSHHDFNTCRKPVDRLDRWFMLCLFLLMFLIRLLYSIHNPPRLAFSMSDSENYYYSGLFFAETGRICYPVPIKTAWIMPGISILIGGLSILFPGGQPLLWAIRIAWILIGSLAPVFLYRSVRLFHIPRWIAVLASLCYVLPWYVQIDCYIQTEGPAFSFFSAALYFGLRLGTEDSFPFDAVRFGIALIGGILFRASTILLFPFMLIWWIISCKLSFHQLLRHSCTAGLILLLCLLPWAIRNAVVFHGFIPLTYASGDPVYEGTFIGEGIPTEEELRELNDGYDAEEVIRRSHPVLFDEQGNPTDENVEQYVSHLVLASLGKHRLFQWFQLHPSAFLKSYLYLKPRQLLNDVWYWDSTAGISLQNAVQFRKINFVLCVLAAVFSLLLKKQRKVVWFLGCTYLINLYLVAASLPLDRYGQAIMPYRLLLGALGFSLLLEALRHLLLRKTIISR